MPLPLFNGHPVKQRPLLTRRACVLTCKACVSVPSSPPSYLHFAGNIPPSSTIGPHQLLLSRRTRKKVASEPSRGQPEQGHLDGGRACPLATRVSRSVLLSVCEAVIRFQDFPSVTGLLTRLNSPLHQVNPHLTSPNLWAAPPQQAGATVTCSHTQPPPLQLQLFLFLSQV